MTGPLLLVTAALAREVSLDEALDLAARNNVENRVAALQIDEAKARVDGVRSRYLPSLNAQAAAQWWSEPLDVVFVEGDPCADLAEGIKPLCDDMVGQFTEPIRLRDTATQHLDLEVRQPLTGLWQVYEGHQATRALHRVAQAQAASTRARVALQVVETWLQAAELEQYVVVAKRGVEALQAHGQRANAFHDAGLVGRSEVLQLAVALSQAKLDLQRALVGQELTCRALAVLTGAEDRSLEPRATVPVELPRIRITDIDAVAGHTPAMEAAQAQADAARAGWRASQAALVPQLGALAHWSRDEGVGELAASKELYAGIGLEWDIWSWGRKRAELDEATARLRQAEVGLAGQREAAALQAESALKQADLALAAWEDAGVTTGQAEENLRFVQAKFDAHAAPSTDLLEAETLLTKARADRVANAFDYLLSVARAQDALGLPLQPFSGVQAP